MGIQRNFSIKNNWLQQRLVLICSTKMLNRIMEKLFVVQWEDEINIRRMLILILNLRMHLAIFFYSAVRKSW